MWGSIDDSVEEQHFYFLLFICLYPIVSIVASTVPLSYFAFKHGWESFCNHFISTSLIILWLLYPEICHWIGTAFSCVTIEDGSVRMFSDLEIICWQGDHMSSIKFLCIPFMILWIIGIPALFYYQLYKNREIIAEIESGK